MKYCPKCSQEKDLRFFYVRKSGNRKDEYYTICKDCMKSRGRDYYQENRVQQSQLANTRRKKAYIIKRDYLIKIKSVPCADCNNKFPYYVMDFDHRDRNDKRANIGHMVVRNWSLENIKKEVEKCDIVCANCHRIRTFKKLAKVAKAVTAGV